jgi:hypothetical protein
MSERIHVYPLGKPEHEQSSACWCEPKLDFKDKESGNEVWIHKQIQ